MRYRVQHTTRYEYDEPVTVCHNIAHLNPRSTPRQHCAYTRIDIQPLPVTTTTRQDYFGNSLCYFTIQQPHSELTITATSDITVNEHDANLNLDIGLSCGQALDLLARAEDDRTLLAREFVLASPLVRPNTELGELGADLFMPDRPLLSAASELTRRIFEEFTYDPEFTTVTTALGEVLEHRRGVCQDFAHLAIGCLRALGFAARYVSGYIETVPPPGQEKLKGADASHAWFAVYVPGEGWFEFDPTNNAMAAQQHITAAWGRDYADVTPLKGVIFGGGEGQRLEVSVDVERQG